MYIYIHSCMHTYIYIFMHTYVHTYLTIKHLKTIFVANHNATTHNHPFVVHTWQVFIFKDFMFDEVNIYIYSEWKKTSLI
jgi:hypothetical protein